MTLAGAITSALDFINPLKGDFRMLSGFGWRKNPVGPGQDFHDGLDYGAPEGTPIYAPADATVGRTYTQAAGGNIVELEHVGGITTGYAHLQRWIVKTGQQVKKGQVIGYVGSTGNVTGPHLHFSAKQDGKAVDPLDIFNFDGGVDPSIYQDIVGDILAALKKSTQEDIGHRTWGEYANEINTDFGIFGGLNFGQSQIKAAIADLGWSDRTIQEGDLERVAAAISEVPAEKAPWDVAAEAAGNIAGVIGATATFLFNPINWARLFALIAGGVLTFVGFQTMWQAAGA